MLKPADQAHHQHSHILSDGAAPVLSDCGMAARPATFSSVQVNCGSRAMPTQLRREARVCSVNPQPSPQLTRGETALSSLLKHKADK